MWIAEILLTVYCWKVGYKWWSLIPLAAAIVLVIILSGTVVYNKTVLMIPDIGATVALSIMLGQKALKFKSMVETKQIAEKEI